MKFQPWRVFLLLIVLCGVGLVPAARADELCFTVVVVNAERAPEAAAHIAQAQKAGSPWILTIDREGARERRAASLRGVPTREGFDRDEYPPAVFKEGGSGAQVRYIPANDNRSAGAQIGNQLKGRPDGCNVLLTTGR